MKTRIYAVDALRAVMMWLVLALHAAISYMTVGAPHLMWAIHDPVFHPFFVRLFWGIHGFAMPVFFLVSGFWTARQYETLGPGAFAAQRSRRILIPFLLAVLFILPVTYYIWCWGWLISGQCTLREIILGQFEQIEIRKNIYGPAHLWFLEYLLIYTVLFFAAKRFSKRPAWEGSERWLFSFFRPFFLVIPTVLILLAHPGARFDFRNSFLPDPFRLLYYSVFFFTGVWYNVFRQRFQELRKFGLLYLVFSVPAFILSDNFLKQYLTGALTGPAFFLFTICAALYSWLAVFSFLGIFLRFFNQENRVIHYLSDASYWVYLAHPPVVGFLQIVFFNVSWPAALKFSVVAFSATTLSLLSYHWFVRSTWIGICLSKSHGEPGEERSAVWAPARKTKGILTAVLAVVILSMGLTYQVLYNAEKSRYTREITGYYRRYFHHEPDPGGLHHWVMFGLNKYGLRRVEQEGFVEMVRQGEAVGPGPEGTR